MIARLLAGATLILTTSGNQAAAQDADAPGPPGQGTAASNGGPGSTTAVPSAPRAPPARDGARAGESEAVELIVVGAETPYQSLRHRIGSYAPRGAPLSWNRIDRFNPLAELLRGDVRPNPRSLRCWVDLSDLRRATLYFAAPGGERFLVRDVALSGRLDEIDQQSLAQVLELSIAALLEDADVGMSRAQAREMLTRAPPVPAEPAPPQAARRWDLVPGAFYAAQLIAASLPVAQGPGLDLAVRRARDEGATAGGRFGPWIAGQYQLSSTARQQDIGVRLQTVAARAGVEATWWHLRARAGAGADWIRVTPLPGTANASAVPVAPHWSRTLVVSGAIAARIPMGLELSGARRPAFTVALFVDAAPQTIRYQVQDTPGTVRVAFAPRRLRPGMALGLTF